MKSILFRILIVLFVLNLSCWQVLAQKMSTKNKKALKYWEKAIENYQKQAFGKTEALLESALAEDPAFVEAYYLLADMAADRHDSEAVIESLQKVLPLEQSPSATTQYMLGQANHALGNYTQAIEHYMEYKAMVNTTEQAKYAQRQIDRCYFADKQEKNPVEFDPVNLGSSINSEFNEYWPSLTADEQTFIFTRLIPAGKRFQEDFFMAEKQADKWGEAKNLGPPTNTLKNEGAQSLSADGKTLVFTACGKEGGMGSCDLYIAYKTKGKWTTPRNMGFPINSGAWESQPSLSADGRTLYFVSNRAGGKGKRDIWVSRLAKNGAWQTPRNLGEHINTEYEESAPFIHPDGHTLYFSSDGHIGMGRNDVFVSRLSRGEWSVPMNLGYPINTRGEERGLITNTRGHLAYIASERKGGFGGLDIYEFLIPENARPGSVTYLKGTVCDKDTKERLVAKVELIDLKTKQSRVVYSGESDGEFLMILPADKRYALNVWRKGYLFYSDHFNLTGAHDKLNPFALTIELMPIKQQQKMILKNVFFDTDKFDLKLESNAELMKLVAFLKSNPSLQIEIGGHTDNQGSKQHNQNLSASRAKAVLSFLVEKGIDANRLSAKGYGFDEPIASNKSTEGRAKNRRTEVKILK